jgi:DNA polymerase III alpha subunit
MSEFAYLHVHTHYSRGGGPSSHDDWCRRASELDYIALGIADRAPMAAFPALHWASAREKLKPIYGVEFDLLLPESGTRKSPPSPEAVVIYARSREGLANLVALSSLAYAAWPRHESPLDWAALVDHHEGLVLMLLGGDEAGALSAFVNAQGKKLEELGGAIKQLFPESAFVGLPHSGRPGDSALADQVASASGRMGLPIIAMPTARYLRANDAPSYEALRAARQRAGWPRAANASTSSTASDRPGSYYLRPREEAEALFKQWPASLENVARVVEMCGGIRDWGLGASGELDGVASLARQKLLGLLNVEELPQDVQARLGAELQLVERNGTVGAWQALSSIAAMPSEQCPTPVPLGAPLGTADGSLLSFAFGLSAVDPMPFALPSWLSNAEPPLPGVEVPSTRSADLLAALSRQLGPDRVALGACVVEITPIQAAQAAATVLGLSGQAQKDLLASAIERGWSAFEGDGEPLEGSITAHRVAASLRGAPLLFIPDRETVIVAPSSVYGAITVQAWGSVLHSEGETLAWLPWTEETLCRLNYSAFCLRPSPALSTLDVALRLAAQYPSPDFHVGDVDLAASPILNEKASAMLAKGEVTGVPYLSRTNASAKQFEGEATAERVAALVARSIARAKPASLTPTLQHLGEQPDGQFLYKDQFASILAQAGLSAKEAQEFHAIILKAETNALQAAKQRFIEKSAQAAVSQEEAKALCDALVAATSDLISRSSAVAWARVALWSLAIKAGHPAALFAGALLTAWQRNDQGKIAELAQEARRLGVTILAPDANQSLSEPNLEREGPSWAILWGLAMLPGWNAAIAEKFVAARPQPGFAGMEELALAAVDAGLSVAQMETLMRAGGCDHLGAREQDRDALIEALPALLDWAKRTRSDSAQLDLFSAQPEPPVLPAIHENDHPPTPRQRHAHRVWEERHLGVAFTEASEIARLRSALDRSGDLRSRLLTSTQIGPDRVGHSVYLIGLLCSIKLLESQTEDPDPLAVAWLEDLDGSIELVAFPPNYKRHQDLWVENNLVIVTARVSQHPEGETYLLCEHLAAFHAGIEEQQLSLTIKPSRQSKEAAPAGEPKSSNGSSPPVLPPAQQPVYTVQQSASPTYKVIVTLPVSADDHADIDRMIKLKKVLAAHPGPDVVTLRIPYSPETGAVTSAQLPRGVRYSDVLESEMRELLGSDALAIIKLIG